MTDMLVRVRDVHKRFALPSSLFSSARPVVHALNGVTIAINRGEAFCLVGESGCGKTTLGRTIMGLEVPTEGQIEYDGVRIDDLD